MNKKPFHSKSSTLPVYTTQNDVVDKVEIALLFGGPSAESDVSILTALGAMSPLDALGISDNQRYTYRPIYLCPSNFWYTGATLRYLDTFHNSDLFPETLSRVSLNLAAGPSKRPAFSVYPTGWKEQLWALLNSSQRKWRFDVALLACHGQLGEDGALAGALELAHVPYTGMRAGDCAIAMHKAHSKILAAHALTQAQHFADNKQITLAKVLPWTSFKKPANARHVDETLLSQQLEQHRLTFPLCIKPMHLGSSIGVAKVTTLVQLQNQLNTIFEIDSEAICEPFVENKREFNLSVARLFQQTEETICSLIEEPINSADSLLDFDKKYRSGDKAKTKGLASAQRHIDPAIPHNLKQSLMLSAATIFNAFDTPSGAPRLDFIFDDSTNTLYFNEINPCPGAFGHYLWHGHPQLGSYDRLLKHLIEEALFLRNTPTFSKKCIPLQAQIFPQKNLS